MNEIGVNVWRGGVQPWECDQMGHLNVAFYLAKASEALAGLAAELGLREAFRPRAQTTLLLRDQHIRYRREARLGAPLHITGGVVELGEADARLLLLMRHADGEFAATFQLMVSHVDALTLQPRLWPAETRARAEALTVSVPEQAAARSCSLAPIDGQAGLNRALALGARQTSLFCVTPGESDVFGRLRPDALLSRFIDGATHLSASRPDRKAFDPKAGVGAAAVEYRFTYFDWPSLGQRVEVRAGTAEVEPKTRRIIYWAFDPDDGRPLCVADSVFVSFDLNTRKMVALEGAALEAERADVMPGLLVSA
jgi:acyl-CoA thioester hydrolase